jgi:O-antigen ligase
MGFLLIPLQFFLIVPYLNEPITLPRSALLALWVAVLCFKNPLNIRLKSKQQLLLLAIPAIYLISGMANHQNPVLMLMGNYNRNFGIVTLLAIAVLVIYLSNTKTKTKDFLVFGILPITGISILYAFIQSTNLDPIIWSEPDRTVLTLGNSNYAAALLGVLVIVPIYGAVVVKNVFFRILLTIAMLSIVWAGLRTQSYQFRVLAFSSILIFATIYFWPRIQRIPVALRSIMFGLFAFVLITFVAINRTDLIAQTNFTDRFSQQKMGLRMFLDHPIFGVGVDQFWRYVPQYLRSEDIQRNGFLVVPDKTHNLIIDHLAMGGIFVGLSFLAFLVYSFLLIYKLNKSDSELLNRSELALLSGIWITYVVHLFISTDNIAMMTLCFTCFGLISRDYYRLVADKPREGRKLQEPRSSGKTITRFVATAMFTSLALLNFNAFGNDAKIKKILNNQIQSGDEIVQTVKSFPNPKTSEEVIIYLLSNVQNCPVAIMVMDDLLEVDNRSGQGWFFKAFCSDAGNDQKSAIHYINKALELQPLNTNYWEAKFRLEVRLKDFLSAQNSLNKLREIEPNSIRLNDLDALLSSSVNS